MTTVNRSIGAWKWSSREKVTETSGIEELEVTTRNKRIASVYARNYRT